MVKSLIARLHRIVDAGIGPGVGHGLAKKIRVTNAVCLGLFVVTLPFAAIFVAMAAPMVAALGLPIALAYVACLVLNARGLPYASRLVFVTAFNGAIAVFAVACGPEAGVHLLLFPLACLALTLFERKDRWCIAWAALLPMALCMTIDHGVASPLVTLPAGTRDLFLLFLVPTTFAVLLASALYLQVANDNAEKELGDVLAARQAEMERSHQILDAITDMIIVKGKGSQLLWGNKAFREYYGMSNEQLRGLIDAPNVSPDLTQKYVRDDLQVLSSGEALVIDEEQAVRYDGVVRWFNTIKAPLKDDQGNTTMLVAVCRDVTQQRESERIIAEQRSRMVASAKLSALGEMAGGIAHEINNPLAIISGRASNLRSLIEERPQRGDLIKQFAADIDQTSHRIAKIIRGLHTFARNGEADPFVKTPLRQIVDDTLALCSSRIRSRGVRVDVADIPEELTLECRPVQISQVLLNLLANAFDAVEGHPEPWIRLAVESDLEFVQIIVTDSGIGIPEALREKVFQPFFTTKAVGKGTGLGLSVTKGIVEDHHGSIAIDASVAHTKFFVWLPERQPVRGTHA